VKSRNKEGNVKEKSIGMNKKSGGGNGNWAVVTQGKGGDGWQFQASADEGHEG